MKSSTNEFKSFLLPTAKAAGDVLMKYFRKKHRIVEKEGAGIVTEADKAAEKLILNRLSRKFPKSSIITEESGEYRRDDSLCWVIDPLDGTSNYAHGFPWFCVSIGLYENGKPRAGVIYHPVLREFFYAEKGRGATLNGKSIKVSRTRRIESSLLSTGFYYSKGKNLRQEVEIFRRMNEAARGVRRPGSAALDLAYVSCGRFDGFWERGLSSWDVAAGFLLVEEAGGKITDYRGRPTTLHDREVVASNRLLHGAMIRNVHALAK